MSETRTITVYRFAELSDSAKQTAVDDWGDNWHWGEDYWQSARAFSAIAPIDITQADYWRRDVECNWTGNDSVAELSGLRAWKWLANNGWLEWARNESLGFCTMTGFCGDAPFGDAIGQYADKPLSCPDLRQVFYECAQEWVNDAANDMEHSNSIEAIEETMGCNDIWFNEHGKVIR